jgi:hypothetical protein
MAEFLRGRAIEANAGAAGSPVRFLPEHPQVLAWQAAIKADRQPPADATPAADALPGWYHAAGRAPFVAVAVVGATFFLLSLGASGGVLSFIVSLVALRYLIPRICRWGMAPANALPRTIKPQKFSSARQQPVSQVPVSPGWVLVKAYLRAVFAYVTTAYLLYAIAKGITPANSILFRLNLLFPLTYFALMLLGYLRQVFLVIIRLTQYLGLRRGIADCAIGAVLGCGVGAIHLTQSFNTGELPSVNDLTMLAIEVAAGAAAGFEFWRGVGSPGVARGTATLLGRFKNGLMRGLRYRL